MKKDRDELEKLQGLALQVKCTHLLKLFQILDAHEYFYKSMMNENAVKLVNDFTHFEGPKFPYVTGAHIESEYIEKDQELRYGEYTEHISKYLKEYGNLLKNIRDLNTTYRELEASKKTVQK